MVWMDWMVIEQHYHEECSNFFDYVWKEVALEQRLIWLHGIPSCMGIFSVCKKYKYKHSY